MLTLAGCATTIPTIRPLSGSGTWPIRFWARLCQVGPMGHCRKKVGRFPHTCAETCGTAAGTYGLWMWETRTTPSAAPYPGNQKKPSAMIR